MLLAPSARCERSDYRASYKRNGPLKLVDEGVASPATSDRGSTSTRCNVLRLQQPRQGECRRAVQDEKNAALGLHSRLQGTLVISRALLRDNLLTSCQGGDDTFGQFPPHLRAILSHALPKLAIVQIQYPKYETRGDLHDCVARFKEWCELLS